MAKKKAYVRYTKQGKLISGSLIVSTVTGSPIDGTYKEVPTDLCCVPECPPVGLQCQRWRYDGPEEFGTLFAWPCTQGAPFGCQEMDILVGQVVCLQYVCYNANPTNFTNLGICIG